VLSFLFSADTSSERDDTKTLFARLTQLEQQTVLGDTELNEDVDAALYRLMQEHQLTADNRLIQSLHNLLTTLADESDLYSVIHTATDAFINDVTLDADNRARMVRKITLYQHAKTHRSQIQAALYDLGNATLSALPEGAHQQAVPSHQTFSVSVLAVVNDPAQLVTRMMGALLSSTLEHTQLFYTLRQALQSNVDYVHEQIRKHALPEDLIRDHSPEQIVQLFLRRTCLHAFFDLDVPFALPQDTRFEHTHIVAGSGHGKTQTLQYLIARDLAQVQAGKMGFAVIDSQGDLIDEITQRQALGELQDKVVIIDPNDIAYPPALNMFDVGLSRSDNVDPVVREKIINGTIDLYAYIFSSLLGAELTQKQGVIFTYLARMMMVIPEATIHTLRELVEDGNQFRPYFKDLDPSSRHFFETQFFSKSFSATRQQVLTRLWGVLSNRVFERMFSAPKNQVDVFEAMNQGKIVLINTAKDLLKTDGCSIFGRFFIALIAQAALSRSILPKDQRTPFMVYIDEAHDYFDERIEDIANQARKYNVGLILSHQNLDQASSKLRASIMSSTSIKLAGGVSAKDAQVLAQNMQTKPEVILSAKKRKKHTQFACYVRNLTEQPLLLKIPFGTLEAMPKMTEQARQQMLAANRQRVAILSEASETAESSVEKFEVAKTEVTAQAPVEDKPSKGKGGEHHKALQRRLFDAATARGIGASIEAHIGDGKHIDVVLRTPERTIACEISVSTSVTHELANLQKCQTAGYREVWLIAEQTAWIDQCRKALKEAEFETQNIQIMTPDEACKAIAQIPTKQGVKTVNGYQVAVETVEIDEQQKQRRELVLAKVLINEN